jgi:hypothetical protein
MTPVTAAASGSTGTRIAVVLAWVGFGLALVCGIAELIAGPGYRLGWWRLDPAFQAMRWAVIVDLAAIVVTVVAAILAYRIRARRALFVSLAGLIASVVAAGLPVYLWRQAEGLPYIHDITTDTDNPPRFVAVVPLRKGASNSTDHSAETVALQKKGYPDIGPAMLNVAPGQALQRAERAARAMGWDIVAARRTTGESKLPIPRRCSASRTTLSFA